MSSSEQIPHVSVLPVKKHLSGVQEWALHEEVRTLVERDETQIVLDFSGLSYINSRGIGVIAACVKVARDAGGDVRLCGLTDTIEKLFHISGMHRIIQIHPDVDAARASYAG